VTSVFEDQKGTLKDFVDRLDRLRINYMLTGSMSMLAYAMMRMTNDIDVVMELRSTDAQRIIDLFEPDYYVPHGRVREAITNKRMFNLLHQRTLVKIDCIIRKDDEYQKTAFSRRQKTSFSGIDLWIISKEDLILSKLKWAKESKSEMQMRDAASILRNGYDTEYVQEWAGKLGVTTLLSECLNLLENNDADGHDS
jgi:hypothetical protein